MTGRDAWKAHEGYFPSQRLAPSVSRCRAQVATEASVPLFDAFFPCFRGESKIVGFSPVPSDENAQTPPTLVLPPTAFHSNFQ